MRGPNTFLAVSLMIVTALAGCSDGDGDLPVDEADFEDFSLEVTEETGIIRGVVVDASVTPVEGVTLSIQGQQKTATTNQNGAFGFADLAPGDYFLKATKLGWSETQQSVSVQANVAEPPIVKILLEKDPSTAPFVQVLEFEGFIECSFSLVAVGFAACNAAGSANDKFIEEYQLEGTPHWAQSEMHWQSTQALGDRMTLLYSAPGGSTLLDNYAESEGASPLVVSADKETLEAYHVGAGTTLMLRVFNAPVEGTDVGDPVNGDDCLDRPVLGGCATGLGATLNQEFNVITHNFYNALPAEGWVFGEDGAPSV